MRLMLRFSLIILLLLSGCGSLPDSDADGGSEITSSTYLRLAQKAYDTGNLLMASSLFKRAADESPNDIKAHLGLARVSTEMGEVDGAIEAYQKALKLKPNDGTIKRNLATLFVSQLKFDEAEKLLVQALNQKPDSKLFNGLGVTYDMMGRNKEAAQSYYAGLVLSPEDEAIKANLSLSLGLQGKTKEAIKMMQALVNGPHATPKLRQNLAFLYVVANQKSLAEKVLRLDMNDSQAEQTMGFYRRVAGETDSAQKIQALMRGIR